MDRATADRIADTMRTEMFPPTNPAVLLEAARTIYMAEGMSREIVELLVWTLSVIANNSGDSMGMPQAMRHGISQAEFARGDSWS